MQNTEWIECTLGDALELKRGYDLPQQSRREGQFPIVSSSGVSGYHDEAKSKAPGVVTGRYGTIGEVFYITTDFWPLNTSLYVRDFKGNEPRFISYLLRSIDFSAYSDKGAVPGVNRNHLHEAKIRLPPVAMQSRIAEFLGSVDDKIELNRKMNETLEQMARAIFKSWFIDFDPVHAKRQGKKPFGMDDATAALFPDSFEQSESGEIPKGWRIGHLGDLLVPFRQSVSAAQIKRGTPYIGLEHMPRGSINLHDWAMGDDVGSQKTTFSKGDILFGRLRPYFKKVGIAHVDGIASTDVIVLRPSRTNFFGIGTMSVSSDACIEFANARSGGTRMPRVSAEDLLDFPVVIPCDATSQIFNDHISLAIKLFENANEESRTLAQTRDLLLPRLLSGELTIEGNTL